jgi:DNA repair exonuclease SbcCD ATPase subunit
MYLTTVNNKKIKIMPIITVKDAQNSLKKAQDSLKKAQENFNKYSTEARNAGLVSLANTYVAQTSVTEAAQKELRTAKEKLEAAKEKLEAAKKALETAKKELETAKKDEKVREKADEEFQQQILDAVVREIVSKRLSGKDVNVADAMKNVLADSDLVEKMTEGHGVELVELQNYEIKIGEELMAIPTTLNGVEITEAQRNSLGLLVQALSGSPLPEDITPSVDLETLTESLNSAIGAEVEKNVSAIKNSTEYLAIAGAKEALRKQLLKGKTIQYDALEIGDINSALNEINLKFTEGGKVEWEVNEANFNSLTPEAKEIATKSIKKLNDELNENKLKGLNDKLSDSINNITQSPQVRNAWDVIIEAIKAFFLGESQEHVAGTKVEEAKKFTQRVTESQGMSASIR